WGLTARLRCWYCGSDGETGLRRGKTGVQTGSPRRCSMKNLRILTVVMAGLLATATMANAERIEAELTGDEEVPVGSTVASGEFRARISFDEQSISYVLTYSGLQGTVTQSHIHVAQPSVNGVIVIW